MSQRWGFLKKEEKREIKQKNFASTNCDFWTKTVYIIKLWQILYRHTICIDKSILYHALSVNLTAEHSDYSLHWVTTFHSSL